MKTRMGPPAGIDLVEATTRLLAKDHVFSDLASALCLSVMAGTVPSVVVGFPQTGQKSGNFVDLYLILIRFALLAKNSPLLVLLRVYLILRAYNIWGLNWEERDRVELHSSGLMSSEAMDTYGVF